MCQCVAMAVSDGIVILLASFSLVTGSVTNVALTKQAWMSSTFDQSHAASKAVDGDTSADSFSHVANTMQGQSTAWWRVDLQTLVQSARVILYFRTDYKHRRNGVHLYTSVTNSSHPKAGHLCDNVRGRPDGTDIPDILNVICPGTWRYLTIYTETDNDGGGVMLDFAEVQVWTCSTGMYGVHCNKNCNSRHCFGSTVSCDSFTGACSSGICQTGWTGADCAVCVNGTYGPSCARNCSSRHCKVFSSMCDHITGACPAGGCQDGWIDVDCSTACSTGMYGVHCNKNCNSRHCFGSTVSCDSFTGACSSGICQTGWTGADCAVCVNGTYGPSCARNCSSRHCKVFSSMCDHITGACPAGGCQDGWIDVDCSTVCTSGKYAAKCTQDCSSRHCKTSSSACDHVRGACQDDGCEAGWMGTDCTTVCASGKYGANCAKDCNLRHCKTSSPICNRINGVCLAGGCEPGWLGTDCTTVNCSDGRYGPRCTEFCNSRNCKTSSSVCDVSGSCTDGCREGWMNADCRMPCRSGTYGSNCSKSCDSRQCKTAQTACDHVTGACTTGCREGWIGADCTQRCKPGTYGPDCSRCGYCDVTCDVGDGHCPGKCLGGFTGDRCDQDGRAFGVTTGVIGGAVGMAVMLLLGGGLMLCLLKHGRLKWIPSSGAEPTEGRETESGCTEAVSTRTPTPGVNDPHYTELDDVTRKREKLPYDAIQSQMYENNQV